MTIPDKLRTISKISEGHFGEVFLCENTYLANRKEAVKVIKTRNIEESARIAEVEKKLFEASVLEYLKKSKYIVEIYDAAIFEKGIRINMEFLENGSVEELLNKNIFLNTKQVLKIAECVLNALEYAHNKGILHLDIKPGNILIKNENIYKLSDFGLASIKNTDGITPFKEIYNSHCPPEKLSGATKEATEQSDIYMFGVTIYRLLNGNPYFSSQLSKLDNKTFRDSIISGKFPDRDGYLPHIHTKLKRIVNKCLNIDTKKRYKNVREIRNDFGKIKTEYIWVPKNISENLYHWNCSVNKKPLLELIAKKDGNLWEIYLFKYGRLRKIRVLKHCDKNLKEDKFSKKIGAIFNEYF